MQGTAPSADAQYNGVPPNNLTLTLGAGGAAAMQGIAPSADAQYDGVPLDAPPSVRQGYGRVDLGRALPLASSAPGWNLQARLGKPWQLPRTLQRRTWLQSFLIMHQQPASPPAHGLGSRWRPLRH